MRLRLAQPDSQRTAKSEAIVAALAKHPAVLKARRLGIFSSVPTEPDLSALTALATAKFCFPRLRNGSMEFAEATFDSLVVTDWHAHVREPATALPAVSPAEIDAILVPGLAFSKRGDRLGRGGGFYDRYLALMPDSAFRLGLCFSSQIVAEIPMQPHDQRVHAVITEDGLLN